MLSVLFFSCKIEQFSSRKYTKGIFCEERSSVKYDSKTNSQEAGEYRIERTPVGHSKKIVYTSPKVVVQNGNEHCKTEQPILPKHIKNNTNNYLTDAGILKQQRTFKVTQASDSLVKKAGEADAMEKKVKKERNDLVKSFFALIGAAAASLAAIGLVLPLKFFEKILGAGGQFLMFLVLAGVAGFIILYILPAMLLLYLFKSVKNFFKIRKIVDKSNVKRLNWINLQIAGIAITLLAGLIGGGILYAKKVNNRE